MKSKIIVSIFLKGILITSTPINPAAVMAGVDAAWLGLLTVVGGAAVLELVGGATPLLATLPPEEEGGAGVMGHGAKVGTVPGWATAGAGPGSCLLHLPSTAAMISGGSGCWLDNILYASIWDLSCVSWWLVRLVGVPGGEGDGPVPG